MCWSAVHYCTVVYIFDSFKVQDKQKCFCHSRRDNPKTQFITKQNLKEHFQKSFGSVVFARRHKGAAQGNIQAERWSQISSQCCKLTGNFILRWPKTTWKRTLCVVSEGIFCTIHEGFFLHLELDDVSYFSYKNVGFVCSLLTSGAKFCSAI